MLILSLLTFAVPFVYADVEFTAPGPGETIPVNKPFTIKWKNGVRAPPIADLTVYTLSLMIGGDDPADQLQIQVFTSGGNYSGPWDMQASILPTIAQSIPNGFFLQMSSTSVNTGYIINYSDRFSVSGMTGTTQSKYVNAALKYKDSTKAPPRGGNALPPASSSAAASSSTATGYHTITVTKNGHAHASVVPNSYNSSSNGSLSGGTIAGIVVVCLLFLVGLLGVGIWACTRRKRQQRRISDQLDDKDNKEEFGLQPSVTSLSELSADGKRIELGDGLPPPEMDSNSVRVELEGDYEYEPSEMEGSPIVMTKEPLTPIAPSISEDTLMDTSPTIPHSSI